LFVVAESIKSAYISVQLKQRMTNPDLGLGSNQVDLGGMMRSASATSISSWMLTGYIAIAALQSI